MGNDQSVGMDGGLALQCQGAEHLWSLELNRGKSGEGEGVCVFTRTQGKGTQDNLCKAGLEHLRLLRHPNVVKFLGTQQLYDQLMVVTEPVIPVSQVLEGMSVEGLVMGWRGVACALDFLHDKAKISHNNLNMGCVYVSTVDSQWKLGGFEAARHFKKIDLPFLSDISSIRHEKAIPPEDKGKGRPNDVPCHSRDVWAFGQLMLTLLEDTALEGHVEEELFHYVREKMMNCDPHLRPVASEVLSQQFMRNLSSELCDFLSKLTLKSRQEKDQFFVELASRLFSLPQAVVAEHIVPLLINPLVMAEPLARDTLWKHLLLPVSSVKPRPHVFDPAHPCPILEKDLFHAHILPLLLNLLESRELHVRMILLSHLPSFAAIIPQHELLATVLPEVLVGLKDARGEVVSATLHTLAELVPLLGPEAVIGTSRQHIFTDSQPRMKPLPVVAGQSEPHQGHVIKSPPKRKTTPPLASKNSREERKERMREKREQQRLKKMAHSKLGKVADQSSIPLLEGDESVETSDGEAPIISMPSPDSVPQYSPSVSHDEKEEEEEEEKWATIEVAEKGDRSREDSDKDFTVEDESSQALSGTRQEKTNHSSLPLLTSLRSNQGGDEGGRNVEGDSDEEWGGFEDDGDDTPGIDAGGWGSAWTTESDIRTDSAASSHSQSDRHQTTPTATPTCVTGSGKGKLKLSSKSKTSSESASPLTNVEDRDGFANSPLSKPASSKLGDKMKGRLKREDIERLEQQALLAAAEPDFFADMAPALRSSNDLLSEVKKMEQPIEASTRTSAYGGLQYKPSDQGDADADGWGNDEDWGEF